ncbi:hypothetical protein [Streptomyces sp. NPDC001568]|uniref:hypothetical protein n=1 Tax=Streptomyces sp. NPDC001568 TaxID=3364588 RepID=UPI0036A23DB0
MSVQEGKAPSRHALRVLADTDGPLSAEDPGVLPERAGQRSATLEQLPSAAAARTTGSRPPTAR